MNKYERLLVLAKEAMDLSEKLEKLKYYLGQIKESTLSEKAKYLLQGQEETMQQYLDILETRILCFVEENTFGKKTLTEEC